MVIDHTFLSIVVIVFILKKFFFEIAFLRDGGCSRAEVAEGGGDDHQKGRGGYIGVRGNLGGGG